MDQLSRVKDLPVPDFGSLQAWEARANAAGRAANGDSNGNDSSKNSQGLGFGGTPMPFVGETKVTLFSYFFPSFQKKLRVCMNKIFFHVFKLLLVVCNLLLWLGRLEGTCIHV